jgi:HAD superfamily hydrolase (TIGR01509 family)
MTLLIYDCDGVLVDSETIACTALAEVITGLGHTMTAADVMREFGGRRLADVLHRAEELLGRPIPADIGERAGRDLLARFRRELRPVDGAADAIQALPYRRCVASSSTPERLHLSLEVTGLASLFGADVYSADEVAHGKPAPDLFLYAATRCGADPADAIVIEDSLPGIAAARAAGMVAIGFAGTGHDVAGMAAELARGGAELVVTRMADLPAAVKELVGRMNVRPPTGGYACKDVCPG